MSAQIISVNMSLLKGVKKEPVESAMVDECGLQGDGHAGAWHRQVSLLSRECVEAFEQSSGKKYGHGDFAENITTHGIDLLSVRLRDTITTDSGVCLEVTQIGKECHGGGCAIFKEVGACIMPHEGIFCRVIKGGTLRAGDQLIHQAHPLNIQIVTLSDRASRGEYADQSGPAISSRLTGFFAKSHWGASCAISCIPDDADQLTSAVGHALDQSADIIFTTGGTGLGLRDITPETIRPLLDKEIPGIMEYIRTKYGATIPAALLSRGIAGMIGKTMVFTLPGSVRAVSEYLDCIIPVLDHALKMIWITGYKH